MTRDPKRRSDGYLNSEGGTARDNTRQYRRRHEGYPSLAVSLGKGSGIYGMINNDNRKLYVGSARDLRHRFVIHRIALQEGRHENAYLQRAFNKNPSAFEFFLIEQCDKPDLIPKEQFWMDFYQVTNPELGYNIAP